MARIYTRTGDAGETSLHGGKRVMKDSPIVSAYGTIDELNASLGVARAACTLEEVERVLVKAQHTLFSCGSDAATPVDSNARIKRVSMGQASALELAIDEFDAQLPVLSRFILPSGGELAARLHFSRTVCRRAERECVRAGVNPAIVVYLNRLGDLLFVLARYAAFREGKPDEPWEATL